MTDDKMKDGRKITVHGEEYVVFLDSGFSIIGAPKTIEEALEDLENEVD